ncbi:MAG TPA: hypothetical protein VF581_11295 [Flavobacterium sp.]|jgi:hypothetical protein
MEATKGLNDLFVYKRWVLSLTLVLTVFIILLSDVRYDVLAMLKLEFAQSQQYFFQVVNDYNYPDALLKIYIYFDFAFIIAFSGLFYFSIDLISKLRYPKNKLGIPMLGLLPGTLDVIEDVLMLQMLHQDGISNFAFDLFRIVVALKWLVVFPCSAAAIIILLYPFSKTIRRKLHSEI